MADDDDRAEGRARVEAERKRIRDAEAEKALDKTAHEVADIAVGGSVPPPPSPPSPLAQDSGDDWVRKQADNLADAPGELRGTSAEKRQGCLQPWGLGAVAAVLVIAFIIFAIFVTRDDSSKKSSPVAADSSCSESGARRDHLRLIACAANGGGGGELSSFAGHYVLTQGLDDPTGLDASGQGGLPSGSAPMGSATIDINDSGAITGGTYHASYEGGGCHRTGDGEGATGSVTSGGTGSVIFTASHTNDGTTCRSESFAFNMMYQFGIVGDDLYMCRSNMATLTTCQAAYPRLVAQFHRG